MTDARLARESSSVVLSGVPASRLARESISVLVHADPSITAGTAAFPGLSLEIAFENGPLESPTWTQIADVAAFEFNRGRSSELDEFQAGTATFVVDNETRRFDFDYTGGDYYGLLKPNRQVRLRANYNSVDYTLWYGVIPTWGPTDYNTQFPDAQFTIHAVDHFSFLAELPLEPKYPFTIEDEILGVIDSTPVIAGNPEYDTQRSGQRIEAILDLIGWPETRRDIDQGLTQLRADVTSGEVLPYLQRIARAETGRLFMGRDGKIVFRERRAWTNRTAELNSQATYTDAVGGTLRYEALPLDPSALNYLRNVIRRENGTHSVLAKDITSVDENGPKPDEQTDSLILRVQEMQDQANDVLNRYKDAVARITEMRVVGHDTPASQFPQILGRDLGERITAVRTPKPGATAVSRECWIESIRQSADASAGTWTCEWGLSTADERDFFTIEDVTLGVIDSVAVFAY